MRATKRYKNREQSQSQRNQTKLAEIQKWIIIRIITRLGKKVRQTILGKFVTKKHYTHATTNIGGRKKIDNIR